MPAFTGLTSGSSDTDGTAFTTASVSPTGSRLLLLAVTSVREDSTNASAPSSVTGNGLTWVQVASVAFDVTASIRGTLTLFRSMGASPSTGAITINFAATHSKAIWSLSQSDSDIDTSGTNGSGAIVQSAADLGTTATLAAFADADNGTFGAMAANSATAWTPGSGFTEIHDLALSMSCFTEFKDANDTTVDASGPTGDVGAIGVEIRAASVPATGTAAVTAVASVAAVGVGSDYDIRSTLALPTEQLLEGRLRTFRVRRGRTGNLERVTAGTKEATYQNGYDSDGVSNGAPLDPANVDSLYYPYVRVLIETKLSRRKNGIRYDRFAGRVESFEPDWIPPSYQEQKVTASDAFAALSSLTLVSDRATLTTALAGTNNDLSYTAVEAGGRGDDITVAYVVAGNNTVLGGATNEPLQGAAFVDLAGPDWGQALLSMFGGSAAASQAPVPASAATFEVRGSEIAIEVATDGAGAPTSTASQIKAFIEASPALSALVTVALAPGNTGAGVVTALAATNLAGGKWPQELTGARINRALDVVGWPAGKRRIDSGAFPVVAQGFAERDKVSALQHAQDCADSELGYLFISGDDYIVYHDGGHRSRETRSTASQATFADVSAGAGYFYSSIKPEYSSDRVRNRVSVTPGYAGAEPQVVEDAASQLFYSPVPGVPVPRDYSKQTLLADDADALAVATAILAAYKDAKVRFEQITLYERVSPAGWHEAVLGREIGDLVTLRTQPPAHSTVGTYDCYVEEIIDDGKPGHPWAVTFSLSLESEGLIVEPDNAPLKDSSGDDFVLDSGTLGVLG